MKKLLLALLFPLMLWGCKKDDPEPVAEIASIVGRWKATEYEREVNGQKVWVTPNGSSDYLQFRFDGLILGSDGLPPCCSPRAYYLNGTLFEVKPKADVPANPSCVSVDCIGCATWTLEQTDNELILTICEPSGIKIRYARD